MSLPPVAKSEAASVINKVFLTPESTQIYTFDDDPIFDKQYGISLDTQLTFSAYMIGATAFWG